MPFINSIKDLIVISVFLLITLTFPKRLIAQELSGAFIMSSVGHIQNFANNSMAVIFSSNSTCFNVQNGAAVIIGERGTGLFVNNCVVDTKFNKLGLQLFPNPIIANATIKTVNTPPLTDEFAISVWNAEGMKLIASKVSGYELYHGKLINMSMLNNGTFIIKIESDKYIEALKFIKAN